MQRTSAGFCEEVLSSHLRLCFDPNSVRVGRICLRPSEKESRVPHPNDPRTAPTSGRTASQTARAPVSAATRTARGAPSPVRHFPCPWVTACSPGSVIAGRYFRHRSGRQRCIGLHESIAGGRCAAPLVERRGRTSAEAPPRSPACRVQHGGRRRSPPPCPPVCKCPSAACQPLSRQHRCRSCRRVCAVTGRAADKRVISGHCGRSRPDRRRAVTAVHPVRVCTHRLSRRPGTPPC